MSIQITTTELPVGYVGQFYSTTLAVNASPSGSSVLWEIRNALPPAIVLNVHTGVLSGLCERTFWSSINVLAQNTSTGDVDQVVLSLYIAETTSLEILTGGLNTATVNQAYTMTLTANGGVPPYGWQAGGLPAGLTCANGQIEGVPTEAGNFSVTLNLVDSSLPTQAVAKVLPLRVSPALVPLQITTSSLPGAELGQTYVQGLSAAGGIPPYSWGAGGLPVGLQIQAATIAGIPTQTGVFNVSLQLADSASPAGIVSTMLPLAVSAAPTVLVIVTLALATAKTNVPYYQLLEAAGGVEPYQWSSDGLPIGLVIDGNSIVGQPKVSGGSVPVTLTITDKQQSTASQFFWLAVSTG